MISSFAQFYPQFIKLWLNVSICYGNANQHNENRTGGRHSAALGADGEDEHSGVVGQALPDARELAGAKFWMCCGWMAGLHSDTNSLSK